MSCALPHQRAGFESESDMKAHRENTRIEKENSINQGRINSESYKTRSIRIQAIIDRAMKSKNQDDFDEEERLRRVLYR